MRKIKDLTGKKFGRMTAIKISGRTKSDQILWLCKCDCGKEKSVRGVALSFGSIRSCGCLLSDTGHFTHRLKHHPLYRVWADMKNRCIAKRSIKSKNYGDRGISVCKSWTKKFLPFYKWAIKNGYVKGLQIDRRNTNGNYTPQNCRFVTGKVNSNNRRNTFMVTVNGEIKSLSEWSEILGISRGALKYRYLRYGDTEKIFKK